MDAPTPSAPNADGTRTRNLALDLAQLAPVELSIYQRGRDELGRMMERFGLRALDALEGIEAAANDAARLLAGLLGQLQVPVPITLAPDGEDGSLDPLRLVDVTLASKDFKVIDNELGNARVDTDVHVTGEIRKPRIEGRVDLSTGTLDVAAVDPRPDRAESMARAMSRALLVYTREQRNIELHSQIRSISTQLRNLPADSVIRPSLASPEGR